MRGAEFSEAAGLLFSTFRHADISRCGPRTKDSVSRSTARSTTFAKFARSSRSLARSFRVVATPLLFSRDGDVGDRGFSRAFAECLRLHSGIATKSGAISLAIRLE